MSDKTEDKTLKDSAADAAKAADATKQAEEAKKDEAKTADGKGKVEVPAPAKKAAKPKKNKLPARSTVEKKKAAAVKASIAHQSPANSAAPVTKRAAKSPAKIKEKPAFATKNAPKATPDKQPKAVEKPREEIDYTKVIRERSNDAKKAFGKADNLKSIREMQPNQFYAAKNKKRNEFVVGTFLGATGTDEFSLNRLVRGASHGSILVTFSESEVSVLTAQQAHDLSMTETPVEEMTES